MGVVEQVRIREVTRDEIDFFFEHGWVTLRRLVEPEDVAGLLARAKGLMGEDGVQNDVFINHSWFQDYSHVSRDDELFRAVSSNPVLGRNVSRLLERESPVRLLMDMLAVKLPIAAVGERGQVSDPHQDYHSVPLDRVSVGIWIALDEIEPEQGPLVYWDGSHKLGPMGQVSQEGMLTAWERLAACPVTEPQRLAPGDAMVHTSLTVHAAPENLSDRPRWVHLLHCFPGDAEYTGKPSLATDGLGLVPHEPIDYPAFPLLYDPARDRP